MESTDQVSSHALSDDLLSHLTTATETLETHIKHFGFVGEGVSGNITTGFIVNQEETE
jgi:hypothetical protein